VPNEINKVRNTQNQPIDPNIKPNQDKAGDLELDIQAARDYFTNDFDGFEQSFNLLKEFFNNHDNDKQFSEEEISEKISELNDIAIRWEEILIHVYTQETEEIGKEFGDFLNQQFLDAFLSKIFEVLELSLQFPEYRPLANKFVSIFLILINNSIIDESKLKTFLDGLVSWHEKQLVQTKSKNFEEMAGEFVDSEVMRKTSMVYLCKQEDKGSQKYGEYLNSEVNLVFNLLEKIDEFIDTGAIQDQCKDILAQNLYNLQILNKYIDIVDTSSVKNIDQNFINSKRERISGLKELYFQKLDEIKNIYDPSQEQIKSLHKIYYELVMTLVIWAEYLTSFGKENKKVIDAVLEIQKEIFDIQIRLSTDYDLIITYRYDLFIKDLTENVWFIREHKLGNNRGFIHENIKRLDSLYDLHKKMGVEGVDYYFQKVKELLNSNGQQFSDQEIFEARNMLEMIIANHLQVGMGVNNINELAVFLHNPRFERKREFRADSQVYCLLFAVLQLLLIDYAKYNDLGEDHFIGGAKDLWNKIKEENKTLEFIDLSNKKNIELFKQLLANAVFDINIQLFVDTPTSTAYKKEDVRGFKNYYINKDLLSIISSHSLIYHIRDDQGDFKDRHGLIIEKNWEVEKEDNSFYKKISQKLRANLQRINNSNVPDEVIINAWWGLKFGYGQPLPNMTYGDGLYIVDYDALIGESELNHQIYLFTRSKPIYRMRSTEVETDPAEFTSQKLVLTQKRVHLAGFRPGPGQKIGAVVQYFVDAHINAEGKLVYNVIEADSELVKNYSKYVALTDMFVNYVTGNTTFEDSRLIQHLINGDVSDTANKIRRRERLVNTFGTDIKFDDANNEWLDSRKLKKEAIHDNLENYFLYLYQQTKNEWKAKNPISDDNLVSLIDLSLIKELLGIEQGYNWDSIELNDLLNEIIIKGLKEDDESINLLIGLIEAYFYIRENDDLEIEEKYQEKLKELAEKISNILLNIDDEDRKKVVGYLEVLQSDLEKKKNLEEINPKDKSEIEIALNKIGLCIEQLGQGLDLSESLVRIIENNLQSGEILDSDYFIKIDQEILPAVVEKFEKEIIIRTIQIRGNKSNFDETELDEILTKAANTRFIVLAEHAFDEYFWINSERLGDPATEASSITVNFMEDKKLINEYIRYKWNLVRAKGFIEKITTAVEGEENILSGVEIKSEQLISALKIIFDEENYKEMTCQTLAEKLVENLIKQNEDLNIDEKQKALIIDLLKEEFKAIKDKFIALTPDEVYEMSEKHPDLEKEIKERQEIAYDVEVLEKPELLVKNNKDYKQPVTMQNYPQNYLAFELTKVMMADFGLGGHYAGEYFHYLKEQRAVHEISDFINKWITYIVLGKKFPKNLWLENLGGENINITVGDKNFQEIFDLALEAMTSEERESIRQDLIASYLGLLDDTSFTDHYRKIFTFFYNLLIANVNLENNNPYRKGEVVLNSTIKNPQHKGYFEKYEYNPNPNKSEQEEVEKEKQYFVKRDNMIQHAVYSIQKSLGLSVNNPDSKNVDKEEFDPFAKQALAGGVQITEIYLPGQYLAADSDYFVTVLDKGRIITKFGQEYWKALKELDYVVEDSEGRHKITDNFVKDIITPYEENGLKQDYSIADQKLLNSKLGLDQLTVEKYVVYLRTELGGDRNLYMRKTMIENGDFGKYGQNMAKGEESLFVKTSEKDEQGRTVYCLNPKHKAVKEIIGHYGNNSDWIIKSADKDNEYIRIIFTDTVEGSSTPVYADANEASLEGVREVDLKISAVFDVNDKFFASDKFHRGDREMRLIPGLIRKLSGPETEDRRSFVSTKSLEDYMEELEKNSQARYSSDFIAFVTSDNENIHLHNDHPNQNQPS